MKFIIAFLMCLYFSTFASFCNNNTSAEIIAFTTNKYNDIVAVIANQTVSLETFEQQLHDQIIIWQQGEHWVAWLTIPLQQAAYIPCALNHQFIPHHTTDKELILTRVFKEISLPPYATATFGVAGLVIDEENNVLVVKERHKPELGYKLPGGGAESHEDIVTAVIREVKEETGIDTEFLGIIAWRQELKPNNRPSDFYFACLLRPLSYAISAQENEITEVRWMPYSEFKTMACEPYSCAQFIQAYEAAGASFTCHTVGSSNRLRLYAPRAISV